MNSGDVVSSAFNELKAHTDELCVQFWIECVLVLFGMSRVCRFDKYMHVYVCVCVHVWVCVCVCLFILIREIGGCWMPCYSMLWASVWIRVSLYGSDRSHQFCGELLIWNSLAITCQIKYNVINNLLQCIGTFVAFFEFISNQFFPSHFFQFFFGFDSLQYSRIFCRISFHSHFQR